MISIYINISTDIDTYQYFNRYRYYRFLLIFFLSLLQGRYREHEIRTLGHLIWYPGSTHPSDKFPLLCSLTSLVHREISLVDYWSVPKLLTVFFSGHQIVTQFWLNNIRLNPTLIGPLGPEQQKKQTKINIFQNWCLYVMRSEKVYTKSQKLISRYP